MSSKSYTPSLNVKQHYIVTKNRRLPIKGEVLCKKGEKVSYNTIVAKTKIPGKIRVINVCLEIGVDPEDIMNHMLIKVGERIKKGDPLALYSYFFGLFKETCYSTITGTLELCSAVTGQALLREEMIPLSLNAYIPGIVKKVLPKEGVIIETIATFIQGIFGIGGENHGKIKMIAKTPDEIVEPDKIGSDCKEKILICGSLIKYETLKKAIEMGAKGLVVGGIKGDVLSSFLGKDLGVMITGQENIDITLIITEGFGKTSMRKKTFDLLKINEGKLACINGATQIRAGVLRPEIIIPLEENMIDKISILQSENSYSENLKVGTKIRLTREPFFGALGKVIEIPIDLRRLESESEVRVLVTELEDGRKVIVPRANVEVIGE